MDLSSLSELVTELIGPNFSSELLNSYGSFSTFMNDGGIFMWIILFIWITGVSISIERLVSLKRYDVDAPSLMHEIQKKVVNNNIKDAINLCSNTSALLPKVCKNGLKRANQKTEQIQNTIDATVLEAIDKIERRTSYLSLLANLSTLMGLLGTIYGLIDSFEAVGAADPSMKAKILSEGIAKAMNTTAIGLMSAMTIMSINTVVTNKSERLIGQMDQFSVKLLDLLGTKKIVYKED